MPIRALNRLRDGNERFVTDRPKQARADMVRIRQQATGQTPFACVLACSDSRVPVEFVFDQGVGDLFVVRTAGNTAGDHEVASLSYAVGALEVPLVVVMGHTNCGAIRAALGDGPSMPEFAPILEEIRMSRAQLPAEPPQDQAPGDRVPMADRVARLHVVDVIDSVIERSPTIAARVRSGWCAVVGAIYDTGSGRVSFFDERGDAGVLRAGGVVVRHNAARPSNARPG